MKRPPPASPHPAPRLILASGSPRRRELLAASGVRAEIVIPGVDESMPRGMTPRRAALAIARRKARAVASRLPTEQAPTIILAADTVVALGDRILGKAKDAADAARILRLLSGTTHRVITGVCAIEMPSRRVQQFAVTTKVVMRTWKPAEVRAYVGSGEWIGKAGAYAIQESADRFVTSVRGSWTNVVGLPMERVAALLTSAGIACSRSLSDRNRSNDRGLEAPAAPASRRARR
ncbi:MAG: septum formation protein Maf [Planctomycetes bacterium]|nr:septum formation protein Maf [Planctomycetota bacterium]